MSSTRSLATQAASAPSNEPAQRDLFDGIGNLPVAPLDLGCLTVSDVLSGSDAPARPLVPYVDARGWRGATDEEVAWWSAAGNLLAVRELERREKGGKRAKAKTKRRKDDEDS